MSAHSVETAMAGAVRAAREAFIAHNIEPTGLVVNVTFDSSDGGAWAFGSRVPDPPPEFLAASLYQSATEAGLSDEDRA